MNPLMNDDSLATSVHDLAPLAREQFVAAIDFGGTKIAVATADMTGSILKQARLDTNAARGCFAIAQAQFFSLRQGDSFAFEQVGFRGLPFYHTLLHSALLQSSSKASTEPVTRRARTCRPARSTGALALAGLPVLRLLPCLEVSGV